MKFMCRLQMGKRYSLQFLILHSADQLFLVLSISLKSFNGSILLCFNVQGELRNTVCLVIYMWLHCNHGLYHFDIKWITSFITSNAFAQVKTNKSKVFPKDMEAPPGGVDDMTRLSYLHEPGVLQNLATRYELNEIYVSALLFLPKILL